MNWLNQFMAGRNGVDQLSVCLVILAVLLRVISGFFNSGILSLLTLILVAFFIFRVISRNIPARRKENDWFMRIYNVLKSKYSEIRMRIQSSRTHKFFKCPGCGNRLRVPRGKGKIYITCPKCGERFSGKS